MESDSAMPEPAALGWEMLKTGLVAGQAVGAGTWWPWLWPMRGICLFAAGKLKLKVED
jgi:hypothetical protein